MTHPPTPQELDSALVGARQTLSILRNQLQAGRVNPAFFEGRLLHLDSLLGQVIESRKTSDQQGRFAKLYELSRVIGSSLDLQTVLNQVMDAIIQLTGAERGFLLMQDDDGNLNVPVRRNIDQETIDPNAISSTITRQVLQSGQAVITTNAQEDPRFAGQVSIVTHNLRSIMASPLRVRGNVIGVVYVDNRIRSGMFMEQDLEVLEAFAGQAAVAIDNARLFSATDQALNARIEELTMLNRLDRQLNETLDLNNAMNVTLEWSSRICGAHYAELSLLTEEEQLRIVASYGQAGAGGAANPDTAHRDVLHHVIQTKQAATETLPGDPPLSRMIVPVRRKGRVIGVITMTAPGSSVFRTEQQALITRMADRAAIAIENARLYNEVRAANNAKSEFVGIVAHELKLPMTSISGYADLIPMAGPINERQAGFLNTIKNAVYRMKVLVSDLNDISRIETGQLRVNLGAVACDEVINAAVESTMTEFERRAHVLQRDLAPDLPRVRADRDRLTQVLLNLLSNAYKYTPDGGQITIGARRNNGQIVFVVADTGVGMSPEQVAKLGTKFWRADNGLNQPGTGLGFAITRHLIESMGGQIQIESTPGKGTRIGFALPVAD
jgi:K+-sensing histidine kinase KdpD